MAGTTYSIISRRSNGSTYSHNKSVNAGRVNLTAARFVVTTTSTLLFHTYNRSNARIEYSLGNKYDGETLVVINLSISAFQNGGDPLIQEQSARKAEAVETRAAAGRRKAEIFMVAGIW